MPETEKQRKKVFSMSLELNKRIKDKIHSYTQYHPINIVSIS